MPRQRRHSARHLLWRGVVAAAGSAAMAAGVYPVLPHLRLVMMRRRDRHALPPGQVASVAVEWAVSVALSAARPAGFLGLPVGVREQRGPRPVIMVHGYGMNRANFLPLARRLARAGLGPLLGFEYWSLGRVASAARRLGAYVEHVCEATGSAEVDLIGHSMGGVVGRYYVTLGRGSERVRNLITIGSPHNGTTLSGFGLGTPKQELHVSSALVQRLRAAPLPDTTRVTVIWSRSDPLVPGAEYARLPGAEEIVYDDLGHLSMLVSPRVARDIIARLGARSG